MYRINMISVNGFYENGVVLLDNDTPLKKSSKVIVTFLDEMLEPDFKRLSLSDFSFHKSREKSKRYSGSISDEIISERRAEL
jgi:calcineurin-like phosphoesterase family protein